MQAQLVTQLADETGEIDVTTPEVDVNINIRDDSVSLFETGDNTLLVRTPEMAEGVFVTAEPTPNGVTAEVVMDVQTDTITPVEPASPQAQPEVSDDPTYAPVEIRMD